MGSTCVVLMLGDTILEPDEAIEWQAPDDPLLEVHPDEAWADWSVEDTPTST